MSKVKSDISYTGIVLVEEDRDALLVAAGHRENENMNGWLEVAHHVTLNLGPAKKPEIQAALGAVVEIMVVAFGSLFVEDGVGIAAVRVALPEHLPFDNAVPHITVAHHTAMKAKQSNDIQEWVPLPEPLVVRGMVQEVPFPKREPVKS
jgi:hypothetical protein